MEDWMQEKIDALSCFSVGKEPSFDLKERVRKISDLLEKKKKLNLKEFRLCSPSVDEKRRFKKKHAMFWKNLEELLGLERNVDYCKRKIRARVVEPVLELLEEYLPHCKLHEHDYIILPKGQILRINKRRSFHVHVYWSLNNRAIGQMIDDYRLQNGRKTEFEEFLDESRPQE